MRRAFLIRSGIQRRYLRLIELSLLIPTFLVGGCLYYLVFSLIADEIAVPEFIALILFPVLKKINLILLIALPIVFILLLGWGVVLTHRLAGPIERLNRELSGIIDGDRKRRLKVRRHDELKGMVDNINRLLDKIEEEKQD